MQAFIQEILGEKFYKQIQPLRYFKDQTGVAFDVREDDIQVYFYFILVIILIF